MEQKYEVRFVYVAVPGNCSDFYSVCCRDEQGNTINSITDVGTKEEAEAFALFLNEGEIHPCHFEDVFEDYFG